MAEDTLQNKDRLLFASGFVFGVMFALLILTVVVATLVQEQGRELLATGTFVTLGVSVFLATVVGAALFLLAFPENAVRIPMGDALHDQDAEGGDGAAGSETAGQPAKNSND